ncbi:esterase-like activity of phytase family protein [Streptomyces yaanensis]|uniref:Esterase-like activity of phytase family protein n=1 Tax=Streptomyces yaanensis TaxID=1142239 RepID=A0ABV7SMY5_9ACTN|nr:esterase-like activity of phytase family protein [Streptomyces sp. CGMCC 4.7035]WNC01988.1 esterase-like activity of phytase family protein [Streptomyces sp. CGMCC 4.7035]
MRLRTLLATVTATLAAAGSLAAAGPATATDTSSTSSTSTPSTSTTSSASTHVCSSTVDIRSFSDGLDKTTYEGTFVGNLSALAVDRDGELAALSDRSSLFTLDRKTVRPTSVVKLADESGADLDSEGLVVDRDGTRLVTSETEPSVRRYSRDGKILDRLPVPDSLRVAPAGRAATNLTFEGLTLLPGGHTLLASMEYSISGDSAGIARFQTWKRHGGHFELAAQYGYRIDAGLGVPEVQATPDGRLLVLERGWTSGVGNTVRLYLADPRHATDTSGIDSLTGQSDVRLIKKTLLADLVNCPSLGATAKQPQPNPLLDNIEGMTITGSTKDRLNVLLVSDDNQNNAQITRLYSLRVRLPHPTAS